MSELKDYSILDIEAIDDERYKKESAPGKWVSESRVYMKEDVDVAIAELKAKLEDVQASAYADSVDAGMRERRLKRALWLARARTAYLEFRLFVKDSVHTDDSAEANNAERMAIKWQKVERKCRAKAEKFGG